jgi:hypothetical protein
MARLMMIVAAAATFVLAVLGARVAAHGMTAPETHRVPDQTAPSAVHATPISGLFERIGDRDVQESRLNGAGLDYIDQRIDRRPERRFDQRFYDRAFY